MSVATVNNAYPSTRPRRVREVIFKSLSLVALVFVSGPRCGSSRMSSSVRCRTGSGAC